MTTRGQTKQVYFKAEHFEVRVLGSWTWKHNPAVSSEGIDTDLAWHRNTKGTQKTLREEKENIKMPKMNLSWEAAAHDLWLQVERVCSVWGIRKASDSYSALNKLWPSSSDSHGLKSIHTHVLFLCHTAIRRIISLQWQVTADKHCLRQWTAQRSALVISFQRWSVFSRAPWWG